MYIKSKSFFKKLLLVLITLYIIRGTAIRGNILSHKILGDGLYLVNLYYSLCYFNVLIPTPTRKSLRRPTSDITLLIID